MSMPIIAFGPETNIDTVLSLLPTNTWWVVDVKGSERGVPFEFTAVVWGEGESAYGMGAITFRLYDHEAGRPGPDFRTVELDDIESITIC